MITRDDVIQKYYKQLKRMTKADQNRVFVSCACGQDHEYTPRTMLEAMEDPNSEDGKAFIEASIKLEESMNDPTKFTIGTKVVESSDVRAGYNLPVATVIAITPEGQYITELFGQTYKHSASELLTYLEAVDLQEKLDKERLLLEEDFNKVRDQIQSKLDQATTLVQEASAIADSCKKDFSSLRNECRPLFRALHDAGWSASSMSC